MAVRLLLNQQEVSNVPSFGGSSCTSPFYSEAAGRYSMDQYLTKQFEILAQSDGLGETMLTYAAVISYLRRQPRRKDRPRCGAKTRAGGTCMVRVEFGKARCRFHGGLSTGPKTEAGRARIAEAQRRRWRAYREKRQMSVAS
jgi:hypothetical protein